MAELTIAHFSCCFLLHSFGSQRIHFVGSALIQRRNTEMGASCCKLDHAVKPDRSDCPSYSDGASGEVGEEEKRDEARPNPLQIARPSIPHSSVDLPDVGTIHSLPLLDRAFD